MAADDRDAAGRLLASLEEQERAVSARRVLVQERILFIRGSGLAVERASQLRALTEQETELSRRRRALHAEIDSIRGEAGLPAWTRQGARGG